MDEIKIRQKGFGSYFISSKPRLKCKKPAPFTGEWLINYDSLYAPKYRLSAIQTAFWKWTAVMIKSMARDQISACPRLPMKHNLWIIWLFFQEEGSGVELHNIRSRSKRNALELYPDNAAEENLECVVVFNLD